jgi:hypothetical protein
MQKLILESNGILTLYAISATLRHKVPNRRNRQRGGRLGMVRKKLSKNDFVTITDIGAYCMVTPSTVRRWINSGKLNAIQLPSGQHRVTVKDLKDFQKKYNILFSFN